MTFSTAAGAWQGISPDQRVLTYAQALSVLSEVQAEVACASMSKPALSGKGYDQPGLHMFTLQFLSERIA